LNRYQLNTHVLNYGTPADTSIPDISTDNRKAYRLEIRTRAGALVRWIEEHVYGVTWFESINEPSTLSLSIDGTWDGAADAVYPNQVWLYRGDNVTVYKKFDILVETHGAAANGPFMSIECEDALSRLGREYVLTEVSFAAGTKLNTIIAYLLAHCQTQIPRVTLGRIGAGIAAVSTEIRWSDKSLLQCLKDLHDIVGGYYWVDGNDKLSWTATRGENGKNWIRLEQNANQIRRRRDYRPLRTRVVAVSGSSVPRALRPVATANDATAQSTYGIIQAPLQIAQYLPEDTLDDIAEEELDRVKAPETSYFVDAIDLSVLDPATYGFQTSMITPGSIIRLVCNDPAIDVKQPIKSIRRSLDDIGNVDISFGAPSTPEETLLDEVIKIKEDIIELKGDTGVKEAIDEAIATDDDTQDAIATAIETDEEIHDAIEAAIIQDDGIQDAIESVIESSLSENPSPLADNLADAITNNETVQDAIEAVAGSGTGAYTDDPEVIVSDTADPGTSALYAKGDHVHVGMPWKTAEDKETLEPLLNDGEIGYTTGTDQRGYMMIGGVLLCLTHVEVSE
jgi:hypothetical protein